MRIFNDLGFKVDKCHFKVLFGGNDDKLYYVEYDPDFCKMIEEILEDFYNNNVLKDVPPDLDSSDEYYNFIGNETIHLVDTEEKICIPSNDELDAQILEFHNTKEKMKEYETLVQGLKNNLCQQIGSNYGIQSKYGKFIYYPVQGRIKEAEVVKELATSYGIPDNIIDEIKESKRGNPFRASRFIPNNTLKG